MPGGVGRQVQGPVQEDVEIALEENVYSYFQFIVPIEKKRSGKAFTLDTIMANVLVLICLGMQGLALWCIFDTIVVKNMTWQNGVMTLGGKNWGLFTSAKTCNDGSSLCIYEDGMYTCSPPSVQLTGRWDMLDVNGDGLWTLEEAKEKQEDVKCRYAVDVLEVFDVFIKILKKRQDMIWLHPDLLAGRAIHKPYFTYVAGDVITCGYGTKDMCPNLLKRGFYNAALETGLSPRVGNTTSSALRYCVDLLKEDGICDEMLPSTYTVWKKESVDQCLEPDYDRFTFQHPVTGKNRSLLEVDYEARETYERFQTPRFFFYKSIMVSLWGLVMMHELKSLVALFKWLRHFPSDTDPEVLMQDRSSQDLAIRGISNFHRAMNVVIFVLRAIMLALLIWVGTQFLLKSADYIDLLFDAVAVVFILEFANILYANAVRRTLREEAESFEAMRVKAYGGIRYMVANPDVVDLLYFIALLAIVVTVMALFNHNQVVPVARALECTCLNSGEYCREAETFGLDFWSKYWTQDVPNVFAQVDILRSGGSLAAAPAPAPAPLLAPAPAALAPAAAPVAAVATKAALQAAGEVVFHLKTGARHHHHRRHHHHHAVVTG
eukprot:TRINITY_DN12701_c0_g1_i1.p1 TRINITY_DN12701_c0_g1~~TRINITY_DN12701_c0_g1_i1.p1  ORF type:complete len:605 (+),score=116.03 TRINITY_DN12701_c0_g1_i1:99-1913(+)